MADKLPLVIYVGHEEKDGAAQNVADALVDKLKEKNLGEPTIQKLSDRKAWEAVKKMSKGGIALVVVDSAPEGMCSAGKKLVRNMNVELDRQGLKEKGVRYIVLTVASSKDSSTAPALKEKVEQNTESMGKAFDSAGCSSLAGTMPSYVDAGVDDPIAVLDKICETLALLSSEISPAENDGDGKVSGYQGGVSVQAPRVAQIGPRTVLLCTGTEAREAAQALVESMGTGCSVEDAKLGSLANAAQEGTKVVLLVECQQGQQGPGLSDGARALSQQLSSVPADIQLQLQKLKFALLTVVATDFGNAGERANAIAARSEIARAADPIARNLEKCGATCLASSCLDLQDANENTITQICETIKSGFGVASG